MQTQSGRKSLHGWVIQDFTHAEEVNVTVVVINTPNL